MWWMARRASGCQTEYGTDIKINLPRTGDFIVRVSDDVATVELPMTLEAGEVEKLNVSLEAGILQLVRHDG